MYKDIISYKLADGITQEQLFEVASKIINTWMSKQEGFIKWEIHSTNTELMTDIVYWESKEAAKAAEKEMANIPNAADWFACYEPGSISSQNLVFLKGF